ncbi:hypothetical protein MMB232_00082 [Brevundimonas subvibrioides]|uniref:hypothetical protein n=1 Tax=Brevundimonas subvibrioides TaxID=74313 RepID=UPI0032D5A57E
MPLSPARLFAAALALAALAPGAMAQTPDAAPAAAFMHAVRSVCGPNIAGRLPFDLMNADLNAARVVLVDASQDAPTRSAFHDLEWADLEFGFVVSDTGSIVVGVNEAVAWCRVVALGVTPADVAAMKAGLAALDDWSETGRLEAGVTQHFARMDGEAVFARVIDPAMAPGYGRTAGLIVTLMNPAAQED